MLCVGRDRIVTCGRRSAFLVTLLTAAAAAANARRAAAAGTVVPGVRMAPPLPRPPGTVRLLLTGDVMLGRGIDQVLPHHAPPDLYEGYVKDARTYTQLAEEVNGPLPEPRGVEYPWGFALQEIPLMAPDVVVVNLETALTARGSPWPGKGIHYRSHPANVAALSAAGVTVASLGNNHVLDWGALGLNDTLDALASAGIQAVGAGHNAQEAQRPALVEVPMAAEVGKAGGVDAGAQPAPAPAGAAQEAAAGDAAPAAAGTASPASAAAPHQQPRVLVWALGHESSGVMEGWQAGPASPGVAVADLSQRGVERLARAVAAHKRAGDLAVASLHWGGNWGFEVPVAQRTFAHALIDEAGVDVVYGHSSHHAKGFEVYHGRLILYGAGDLISDYEGIQNMGVEWRYPKASHRDDVGLLWWVDVTTGDGRLAQLAMTPTRLRHMRLERPDPVDIRYARDTMDREARRMGVVGGVKEADCSDGVARLLVVLPPQQAIG